MNPEKQLMIKCGLCNKLYIEKGKINQNKYYNCEECENKIYLGKCVICGKKIIIDKELMNYPIPEKIFKVCSSHLRDKKVYCSNCGALIYDGKYGIITYPISIRSKNLRNTTENIVESCQKCKVNKVSCMPPMYIPFVLDGNENSEYLVSFNFKSQFDKFLDNFEKQNIDNKYLKSVTFIEKCGSNNTNIIKFPFMSLKNIDNEILNMFRSAIDIPKHNNLPFKYSMTVLTVDTLLTVKSFIQSKEELYYLLLDITRGCNASGAPYGTADLHNLRKPISTEDNTNIIKILILLVDFCSKAKREKVNLKNFNQHIMENGDEKSYNYKRHELGLLKKCGNKYSKSKKQKGTFLDFVMSDYRKEELEYLRRLNKNLINVRREQIREIYRDVNVSEIYSPEYNFSSTLFSPFGSSNSDTHNIF